MSGFRIVWKGLRGVFDHLFRYLIASALWYLAIVLVVPGPAATLALYRTTDPRWGYAQDPPTWIETLRFLRANLWRGWKLVFATVPLLILFVFNIRFYSLRESHLGVLTPLWVVLLVLWIAVTIVTFAVAALEPTPVIAALRRGAAITAARLPRVLLVFVFCLLFGIVSFALTPFLLLYPAVVTSIVNRLVLDTLRIPIPDPTAPTPEREIERHAKPR